MKKLFLNIIISFLLLFISILCIWFAPGNYPHDLAALVNKKNMLISAKSPRLILMGGSSVLSIKSQLIEKQLNYSVVNLSLWGGLSQERYIDEIEPYLRKGDLVVITQEYPAALDAEYIPFINTNEQSKQFFFLMSPGKNTLSMLYKKEYFKWAKIIIELTQIKARSYIRNIMTLNFSRLFVPGLPDYDVKFNNHGDRSTPYRPLRPLQDSGKIYKETRKNSPAILPDLKNHAFLNRFYDKTHQKGIKIFFYFAPFPETEYDKNKADIMAYYTLFKENMKFPIINSPDDFRYPREYFADTIYHLNDKGETIRTPKLISFIKKGLQLK